MWTPRQHHFITFSTKFCHRSWFEWICIHIWHTWHGKSQPPIHHSPLRPLCVTRAPFGFRGWSWWWNSTETKERVGVGGWFSEKAAGVSSASQHVLGRHKHDLRDNCGAQVKLFHSLFLIHVCVPALPLRTSSGWFKTAQGPGKPHLPRPPAQLMEHGEGNLVQLGSHLFPSN